MLKSPSPVPLNAIDNSLFERGKALYSAGNPMNGKYLEAIAIFDQIIARNPNFEEVYRFRADSYLALKNHEKALQDCNKAIQLLPTNYLGHFLRGLVLYGMNKIDMAISNWDEAISLNPNFFGTYYHRARALSLVNEHGKALADAIKMNELRPGYEPTLLPRLQIIINKINALKEQGEGLYKKAQYATALPIFQELTKIDPNNFEAWCSLGNCYHNVLPVNYEAAAEAFASGIKANPDYANNHSGLGHALKSLGKYNEAIKAYENASTLAPKFYQSHYYLVNLLLLIGDYRKALNFANKCIALAPNYPEKDWLAKINLFSEAAKLYEKTPDHDPDYMNALHKFQEFVKLAPKNAAAWWYIGQCYQNIKPADYVQAAEAFAKSVAAYPEYFYGFNGGGLALFQLKKFSEARNAFANAKSIAPEHAANLYQLSRCCSYLGDSLGAMENAREMDRLDPARQPGWRAKMEAIHTLQTRANAFLKAKDYARALADFQELTKLDPNNPFFWSAFGQAQRLVSPLDLIASAKSLSKAVTLYPSDPYAWHELGMTINLLNNPKKAKIAFMNASTLLPTYYQNHYQLSVCLANLGEYNEALVFAEKMHEQDPSKSYSLDWLKQIREKVEAVNLFNGGDYQKALPLFQKFNQTPENKWYTKHCSEDGRNLSSGCKPPRPL